MSTGVYSNTTPVIATKRVRKQRSLNINPHNVNKAAFSGIVSKFKGLDGKDGRDGRDGKDGKDGCDGQQGPAGIAGQNGLNGRDGAAGPQGPQGPKGEPAFALTGFGYSFTGSQLNLPGGTDVQTPGTGTQGAVFNYMNGNAVNQGNMTISVNGGEIWAFELIADGITADIFPLSVSLKIGGNVITSVSIPSKDFVGFQVPGCAVIRGTSVANNKHTVPAGTNALILSSNVACVLTDFMIIGHRIF